MAQYIIRIDDICREMNVNNFKKLAQILNSRNIRPIIGIIPNNEDSSLDWKGSSFWTNDEYYDFIRSLVVNNKWDIAMHGYDHVYITKNKGLCSRNHFSEFAGLPFSEQNFKISEGLRILNDKGIFTKTFMAPGHTFDETTLKALKNNGIYFITDGIGLYPYYKDEVLFVPQIESKPHWRLLGVHTICLHINNWNEPDFKQLISFLDKYGSKCVSFKEVSNTPKVRKSKNIVNNICKIYTKAKWGVSPILKK